MYIAVSYHLFSFDCRAPEIKKMADSSQTAGTMDTQNFQDDVHAEQTRWVNFYWNRQLCCICQQSKTYAIQPGEAGGTGKFLTRRRSCEVRKQPGPPALPGWIAVLTCFSAVLCLACIKFTSWRMTRWCKQHWGTFQRKLFALELPQPQEFDIWKGGWASEIPLPDLFFW